MRISNKFAAAVCILASSYALSACQTMGGGAVTGGAAGAGIGYLAGGEDGAITGTIIGGLLGGVLGGFNNAVQQQRAAEIRAANPCDVRITGQTSAGYGSQAYGAGGTSRTEYVCDVIGPMPSDAGGSVPAQMPHPLKR